MHSGWMVFLPFSLAGVLFVAALVFSFAGDEILFYIHMLDVYEREERLSLVITLFLDWYGIENVEEIVDILQDLEDEDDYVNPRDVFFSHFS